MSELELSSLIFGPCRDFETSPLDLFISPLDLLRSLFCELSLYVSFTF